MDGDDELVLDVFRIQYLQFPDLFRIAAKEDRIVLWIARMRTVQYPFRIAFEALQRFRTVEAFFSLAAGKVL